MCILETIYIYTLTYQQELVRLHPMRIRVLDILTLGPAEPSCPWGPAGPCATLASPSGPKWPSTPCDIPASSSNNDAIWLGEGVAKVSIMKSCMHDRCSEPCWVMS